MAMMLGIGKRRRWKRWNNKLHLVGLLTAALSYWRMVCFMIALDQNASKESSNPAALPNIAQVATQKRRRDDNKLDSQQQQQQQQQQEVVAEQDTRVVVSVQEGHYRCSTGLHYGENIPTQTLSLSSSLQGTRRIPKQVFQTCRRKCLVPSVVRATKLWQFGPGWGYYLYDDANVDDFFQEHANEFPLLGEISHHCLVHGTLKADVWRYLVLWVRIRCLLSNNRKK